MFDRCSRDLNLNYPHITGISVSALFDFEKISKRVLLFYKIFFNRPDFSGAEDASMNPAFLFSEERNPLCQLRHRQGEDHRYGCGQGEQRTEALRIHCPEMR